MELNILEKKENKNFPRQEIKFEVAYAEAPPKRLEIRDELCKKSNADKNCVVIQQIRNIFGVRKSIGLANVYQKPEDAIKYELRYKLIRMGLAEKKSKTAEAPKPAAKK
jgi:small subunit ribosomal protein S24e